MTDKEIELMEYIRSIAEYELKMLAKEEPCEERECDRCGLPTKDNDMTYCEYCDQELADWEWEDQQNKNRKN